MFCCDSMCVAGCSGGTTESHCVVSEKGGAEMTLFLFSQYAVTVTHYS